LLEGAVRDALGRGLVRRTQLLTASGHEPERSRLRAAIEAATSAERMPGFKGGEG
jgi:hypothetical protein